MSQKYMAAQTSPEHLIVYSVLHGITENYADPVPAL